MSVKVYGELYPYFIYLNASKFGQACHSSPSRDHFPLPRISLSPFYHFGDLFDFIGGGGDLFPLSPREIYNI